MSALCSLQNASLRVGVAARSAVQSTARAVHAAGSLLNVHRCGKF